MRHPTRPTTFRQSRATESTLPQLPISSRHLTTSRNMIAIVTMVLGALHLAPAHVFAQDGPQTLILFDISGSMWGKLSGATKPKFEAAADAVKAARPPGKATKSTAGLILFGGSCTSAPMTVPAAPGSMDVINTVLGRLNPKGKGPISLALESAAKALPKNTPSNVILIHDGPDNCKRDPCATAQSFAQTHKGVPVHLISIGLPIASRVSTACIAKLTGGTIAQVENVVQLDAAIKHAMALALRSSTDPAKSPKTSQNDDTNPAKDLPPDKTGPSRLRLAAKLGKSGPYLKNPVRWQVSRLKENDTKGPLLDVAESRFTLPLKPGSYVVNAHIGILEQRHTVEIADKGATDLIVIFDAGTIAMRARGVANPATGQTPLDGEGTIVTFAPVTKSKDDAQPTDVTAAPIVVAAGTTSEVIMPSGTYTLVTQKGRVRNERTISVKTGAITQLDLATKTGELNVRLATSTQSNTTHDVLYKLYIDNPERESGRQEIARSTAPSPSFILTAGTYYITGQIGLATTRELVAISAGSTKTVELNLPTAYLRLQTQLLISGQPSKLPVQYRIIKLSKVEQEVTRSNKRNPKFTVNPGKYRIVAEIGARNVIATTEVELPPGSKTNITLKPSAGEVVLNLSKDAGAGSVNRYWIVRDQTGKIVWRTNAFAPSALLAPGTYEVSCETRNGELRQAFNLTAGEKKQIVLASK